MDTKLDGQMRIDDFLDVLASKSPVPGGGGATALAAAIGSALCSMTCSLTIGKKKYADVEEDIKALDESARALRTRFVELIEEDAEGFEPLAAAFRMPSETQEQLELKQETLEREYVGACKVPFEIMDCCCQGISICIQVAQKGSQMVLSDVASGLILLEAALRSASLNIYINTRSMRDREKAEAIKNRADEMLDIYTASAGDAYEAILAKLKE